MPNAKVGHISQAGREHLRFLSGQSVRELVKRESTPLFVYSRHALKDQTKEALAFSSPFGVTVRYAMKANPHPEILKLFYQAGIWIDASSGPEAQAAMDAGIKPEHIMLTTQQLPQNLGELIERGVQFNACSLNQLDVYCQLAPNSEISVRINPGMGTGMNRRVTTGGITAAFGIWHEYIDRIHEITNKAGVTITQVHTHIGSGTDPDEWLADTHLTLDLLKHFPGAVSMSLGGGFKVGRMSHEHSADMAHISERIAELIGEYAATTGRKLRLEIEPGTFLVATAGTLITEVIDVKDTGEEGFTFALINSGMNDILRPSMYGAQHPLIVVPKTQEERADMECIVAGHCCESGDILTVAYGESEVIEPRPMLEPKIGDYMCVEGAGAYCASMRASTYNSFEPAKEVFID